MPIPQNGQKHLNLFLVQVWQTKESARVSRELFPCRKINVVVGGKLNPMTFPFAWHSSRIIIFSVVTLNSLFNVLLSFRTLIIFFLIFQVLLHRCFTFTIYVSMFATQSFGRLMGFKISFAQTYHRRYSIKKLLLKILQNSQENTCFIVYFL